MNEIKSEKAVSTEADVDALKAQGAYVFPASSGQRRLWFLEQLQHGDGAYNIPVAFLLEGDLDADLLEKALQDLVNRHEVLRTRLVTVDSNLAQAVLPAQETSLLRVKAEGIPMEEALEMAGREAKRSFDLSSDPLLRCTLFTLDAHRALFLATFHHCVFDGWSMGVFFEELGQLYAGYTTGAPAELPELSIQYPDYSIWQKEWMESEAYTKQLAFWKERLTGDLSPLELPTDRLRPAVQTYAGARHPFSIPASLLDRIKQVGQRQKSSLFMTLMAGLQSVLYRYSGQETFYVGAPVANRSMSELEQLIGFFVNTLPIAAEFSNPGTFLDTLNRVRAEALAAFEHQEIPFEKLIDELDVERDISRNPIFQVMLQVSPEQAWDLPGINTDPVIVDQGASQVDLALHVWESDAGLRGFIEYNTDLFDAATVKQLGDHYAAFLEQVAEDPNLPVRETPLLSDDERRRILETWNDTARPYDLDQCLHGMFEAQVERTPDAVALVYEGASLTYREMNERANRLAHFLQSKDVGPETMVGVAMERSFEMVVALYAILKAGGAYVPIDPSYPEERVAFMLEDAGIGVLLTQSHLASVLGGYQGLVVNLDADWQSAGDFSIENPSADVSPDTLAYVIYTSGSTGKPKGVMIEHRAIVNRLIWMQEAFPLDETDAVLQKTPFSFDVSVWEFFWPLQVGARLVIARPEGHKDNAYLAQTIIDERVTTIHFVPSMLQLFVEAERAGECTSLRRVICSGEALSVAHQQRFFERVPAELHNLYGPTEAAVDVTHWPCRPNDELRSVPIGRPIGNIQLYVLDALMQPVPIGVAGELHIGGIGLALGYLNRAALTEEKFVPNPFDDTPGARLYKTGDLVRFLPNGNIEYIGRLDFQVKVRGFRIELGEIEEAMLRHTHVQECTVIVREDVPGDKRLAAYLVSSADLPIDELRRFLGDQVPDYMIPSAFIALDRIPLTPNGKVDRRALPAPEVDRAALTNAYQPPSSPAETTLAGIWADVLRLDRVGVRDNFFELGGDSILAIQITSRANQAGLRLAPHEIFKNKTVAELALAADVRDVVVAADAPAAGEAPLTPIQHWFFEQEFAEPAHWNMAIELDVDPAVDATLLGEALEAIWAHHDAFRLRFDGERQWYADAHGCSLTHYDAAEADYEDIVLELQQGMDLERGPMMRAGLIAFAGEAPRRLVLAAHHLVMDGVSWRILLEDLDAACEKLARSEVPALPAKTTAFGTWADGLAAHAKTDAVAAEMTYWNAPERNRAIPLPAEDAGAANTVAATQVLSVWLDEEETRALLAEVPEVYHTQMNDVLLTALVEAFAPWTGRRTLLVDLEGHGREPIGEAIDVSRTIGWFTSLYPVLLDLEGVAEPGETLKVVKEQLRGIPSRGLGYGLLRYGSDDLSSREALVGQPRAEVMFNYLGQFTAKKSATSRFTWRDGFAGATRGLRNTRCHKLEVSGMITDGRLRFDWVYNEALHDRETVQRLADRYAGSLRELIDHCRRPDAGGFTPSDFPDATLTQRGLDDLLASLSQFSDHTETDRNVEAIYPLLPAQQSLLLHHLFAGNKDQGFLQFRFDIEGDLQVDRFKAAWAEVVARHAALRTLVVWENQETPLQVVRRMVELPWREYDHGSVDARNRANEIQRFLQKDRMRGIDLNAAPAFRFSLLSFSDTDHHFVWSHHHMTLDGWSVFIVLKEVWAVYQALISGRKTPLQPARSFRDYVAWTKEQDESRARAFWRDRYRDAPRLSGLDMMKAPSTGQKTRFETLSLTLPETLSLRLGEFTRAHQITVNTLIQAAWALVLQRYGSEGDVVFGITVSGRSAPLRGIESIVGNLANNIPFRIPDSAGKGTISWLQSLRDEQMEVVEYEYSSAAKVHEWSGLTNVPSLFDTLFIFENYPAESLSDGEGAPVIRNLQGGITTSYPLSLVVTPGKEMEIELIYDVYRMSGRGVQQLHTTLKSLLECVVDAASGQVASWIAAAGAEAPARQKRPATRGHGVVSDASGETVPMDLSDDVLEARLGSMFEHVLGVSVSREDDFFDLGGRSMQAVSLFGQIQKQFGQNLPLATLFQAPTVKQLADVIRQKDWSPSWSSLVAIQPRGSRPPLFCIHGAEGNVLIYQALSRYLGKDQPVYGIQSQGLDGSAPAETTIEEMAARYVDEIQSLYPEGPYLLAGYCMGGTLAFEVARQLQLRGKETPLVVMLDTYCDWNNATRSQPIYKGLRFLQKVLFHLANLVLGGAHGGGRFIASKLRIAGIRTAMLARVGLSRLGLRFGGGNYPHVLLREVNDEAALRYVPSLYPGRVTVIRSRSLYAGYDMPDLGWKEDVATGGVDVRTVPVYPAGMLVEPLVQHLAEEMKSCIQEALQKETSAVLQGQEA